MWFTRESVRIKLTHDLVRINKSKRNIINPNVCEDVTQKLLTHNNEFNFNRYYVREFHPFIYPSPQTYAFKFPLIFRLPAFETLLKNKNKLDTMYTLFS